MEQQARGSFDVRLAPAAVAHADAGIGRLSIDKQFHGDLDASSVGEMLSAMGDRKDSAGYVAMERVTGTLHGRRGSFALQHSGTMTRGEPTLHVSVVPDSATDELAGLRGTLQIIIDGKEHRYVLDYRLPA